MFNPFGQLSRWGRQQWLIAAVYAGIVAAVLVLTIPQLWAWYHWHAGRSALQRYHNEAALEHFNACLHVWKTSVPGHLLACRAARRLEHFDVARSHLDSCQRLVKGTNADIALEDALLRVSMGEIEELEAPLRARMERDPAYAPLVLEALAEGYRRMYRMLEAQNCLAQWLTIEPDNTGALFLRGKTSQQVRRWEQAVADFRKVVELDPEQDDARQRLVQGLLELSRYEEALGHLVYLQQRARDDFDLQVRMARCYQGMGQSKRARQILQGILEKDPEHGPALFVLGKIALMAGQLDEAERWLRQASRAMPFDYQTQWHLYEALRRQDENSPEAREQLARAEKLKQHLERLSEISTRKMSVRPHDAALHYEIGMLLMELGNKEGGARWLSSAVREKNGDYPEAQLALARYFEELGDPQKAEEYRRDAQAAANAPR